MKTKIIKTNTVSALVLIATLTLSIMSCQKSDLASNPLNNYGSEAKIATPVVPAIIAVPDGNKVIWHAYATGTQIYKVTQSTTDPNVYLWSFVAPLATLYSDADYTIQVGLHYVGPTWQATTGKKSGEYVVGTKLTSIVQDVTAVPWLLLQAVPSSDPNYYTQVTYIQRLYTVGGLAPTTGNDAAHLGVQDSIPYTAEYYFYGAK